MINAKALGKLLAEEVIEEKGPCLYPGKFHPPHIGHFKAATQIASREYITEVIIILSTKVASETGNITPEQALAIWNLYLSAQPNSKIKVKISEHASPVVDMFQFIGDAVQSVAQKGEKPPTIYVAAGDDEADDQNYAQSLQQKYPKNVKTITVHEKDGEVSAPHIRTLVQQNDYESFKSTLPVAAFNKGAAPKIWKILTSTVPSEPEQGTT